MRLVIRTNEGLNVHLTNDLDVDQKITLLLNIQNHLNITRNDERNSVSVKEVIMHRINNSILVIITMTKIYMHLWHVCLIMANVLVDISVTVCY